MSEYLLTAAYRPDTLSWDNFLLNHSTSYKVATFTLAAPSPKRALHRPPRARAQAMVVVCWVEYWAEWALLDSRWPGGKQWSAITAAGLVLSAAGLLTRSVAMAGGTFLI